VEQPTQDPAVVIEACEPGWGRYRNTLTGRCWEVHGTCDNRGDCLIGAVIDVRGEQVQVRDHGHLAELRARLGPRLGHDLDSPVTPEFTGCCPFTYRELEPAAPDAG
jgi:hypothetical protein